MKLNDEIKARLGTAFNEATLLGVEIVSEERIAAATLAVLSLPEVGDPPDDSRVQVLFAPVGRVVASLRLGNWDDLNAEVVSFELSDLLEVVQSFEGQPIYGWEFFDKHEDALSEWGDRLSLDWRSGSDGSAHSVLLFQEGRGRHLDLLIWFDGLAVLDPKGQMIPLDEFASGGERWWAGMNAGDPRTQGSGIFRPEDMPAGPHNPPL